MSIYDSLEKIFQNITLDFCDSTGKILLNSQIMVSISNLKEFRKNLETIFQFNSDFSANSIIS